MKPHETTTGMIFGAEPLPTGTSASATEAYLPVMVGNDPSVKELRDWVEAVRRIAASKDWSWILNKARSLFAIQQGDPHPMSVASPQTVTASMTVQEKNSILKWNIEIELALRGERTKEAAVADFEIGQKNKLANLILAALATKARSWPGTTRLSRSCATGLRPCGGLQLE